MSTVPKFRHGFRRSVSELTLSNIGVYALDSFIDISTVLFSVSVTLIVLGVAVIRSQNWNKNYQNGYIFGALLMFAVAMTLSLVQETTYLFPMSLVAFVLLGILFREIGIFRNMINEIKS